MSIIRIVGLLVLGFCIGAVCWSIQLVWKATSLLKKIENAEGLCIMLNQSLDFCKETNKDYTKVCYKFEMGHQHYFFVNTAEYIFYIVEKVNEIKEICEQITPFEKECLEECTKLKDIDERKDELVSLIDELVEKLNSKS